MRGGHGRAPLQVALALSLAAASLACERGDREPALRLVLITLDTLRYDSFAGRGRGGTDMPRTRAWAENAAVFDRFYAASSSTQPTHATLFTGLHPWEHGVASNVAVLSEERVTLAEILRDAGFGTYAAVASFPVHRRFGFAQGFDVYQDEFERGGRGGAWSEATDDAEAPFYSLAQSVTDTAIELLDAARERRQFLWVHYYDPHAPYGNTRERMALWPWEVLATALGGDPNAAVALAREFYDADVRFLDAQLDRLLRRLAADEGEFATHVVLTSDHGEAFGEGGSVGHGKRILPAVVHVPTAIRSARVRPGVRSDVASSVDLAPTLLALAGVERSTPRGRVLLGGPAADAEAVGMRRSFEEPYPEIRLDGKTYRVHGPLFYHVDAHGRFVRGNSRRIVDAAPDGPSDALRARFRSFEESLAASASPEELPPEDRAALEALGYVP
ncbi:MAG: sulfatase [Planctomycetota bacterium]|jgi:arylsulfatase A-like enzyme